jgi:hypothetical protein
MQIENKATRTFEAPASGEALISIEIGASGILRVYIISEKDGADEQAEAHRLLATVMPQLCILDDALRSPARPATPYTNPKKLFELGWTIPDVVEATGISRQEAETLCHEAVVADAEDKESFSNLLRK